MAISRLPAPVRLSILSAIFMLPPAAAGWLALRPLGVIGARLLGGRGVPLDWLGAAAGLQLGWTLLLLLALRAERIIGRALRASPLRDLGTSPLGQALAHGHHRVGDVVQPAVAVFVDPRPAALAARSLGGAGTIFVSQGLASSLSDDELQAVLEHGAARLREKGAVLQSLGAVLCLGIARLLPRTWVNVFFSYGRDTEAPLPSWPISFAVFIAILPWLRGMAALTRKKATHVPPPPGRVDPLAWNSALRKMESAAVVGGSLRGFGADFLYLADPRGQVSLVPGLRLN